MKGYNWVHNAPDVREHGSPTATMNGACICSGCELARFPSLTVGPAKGAVALARGWVGLYIRDPREVAREDGLPPLVTRGHPPTGPSQGPEPIGSRAPRASGSDNPLKLHKA